MQLPIGSEIRYQTKQEMVYHSLHDAIMRGELRPGQRLVIDEIAQTLNVSHIPVREALQLLQSERLVELIPHTGARVTSISRDSLAEVFTVMEGLELVATRIATERLTDEHVKALQLLLAEMDGAVQAREYNRWGDLNTRFHRGIASMTGMPMLQEMTDRALRQWDRIRYYFFGKGLSYRVNQAQREHHAMVRAMQDRDVAQLEQLVKLHNRGALEVYTEYMSHESPPEEQ